MIFVRDVLRLLMKASFKIVIIITSFVFLFDQLTKYLVLQNFEILSSVFEVFKGCLGCLRVL